MRSCRVCVSSDVPVAAKRCYRIFMVFVAIFVMVLFFKSTRNRSSLYSETFLVQLQGPLKDDDPRLIQYIRNEILEPPSKEPYNLTGDFNRLLHEVKPSSDKFYSNELSRIFEDKKNGFFVEAGALDGETMSTTLTLEREKGWTGLLVEVDKVAFKGLKSKNRKAWSANVCLSPNPYPAQELLEEAHTIKTFDGYLLAYQQRAMSRLMKFSNQKAANGKNWSWAQCVPLQSLLKALDVHTVNLLVLDIEGAEMSVLRQLDLSNSNVEVICLEWKKTDEAINVIQEIEARDYKLLVQHNEDFIFAKKGSPYEYYKSEMLFKGFKS